jgi:signal transduction histidine kinase
MKAKELKFGTVLDFNEEQGHISFRGNRFLLIDAEAMGLLRREIIGVLGQEMTRRLLVRYGYACGYYDALRLRQEYQWEDEEEWLMAGPMMHRLEGIVQAIPHTLTYSRQQDTFLMEGEWLNSYEAAQHIKHFGKSGQPVCWTLSGYASGYASAFFKEQVICIERECTGKGDLHCKWVIRRPHQMGYEGQQALRDLQGFNLAGQINMLEEQIAARTSELSALNAVSIMLGESLSLDELLQRVLPHVLKATGTEFGRIFLLNDEGNKLELRVQTEPDQINLELEPTQLYVSLPVSERGGWGRLRAGNLVVSHNLAGIALLPELSGRHKWRSLCSVPLMERSTIVGVMELASPNTQWPNTAEERRLLLSLGRQIGMALGNARLYEQEQQRARAWRGLVEISHKVASSLDKQQVLESLVEYSRELLNSEISLVSLLDVENHELEIVATAGVRRNSKLKNLKIKVGQGYSRSFLVNEQPVIIVDYLNDPRLEGQPTPAVLEEGIVSMLAVPLTARGNVLGVLFVAERHRHVYSEAEAELLKALATQAAITVDTARLHEREIERVKEVERIKADFLAMVTHELRTPLTNIKGMSSSLLQKDVEWDEENKRAFLEVINEEADVLTNLVSNLLDMSRMEAGAWTIHLEVCTLEEITQEVRRKLAGLLLHHRLAVKVPPGFPSLRVDPNQIGRVLVNLLTNSIKYTPPGTITISACELNREWVEIRVADEGPGIPLEDRQYIFDKFYRSSKIAGFSSTGAGLGLAIVRGIIEAHGGEIELAEPVNSTGTIFCFTLPTCYG